MSDGQALLLVVALLYLSECFSWVSKHSVAFISGWGRHWRVAQLTSWLGNARGAFLFLNPFPPLGGLYLAHLSPVSISPFGICAANLQSPPATGRAGSQTGRVLAFNDISGAGSDGSYVLVNGERFAKCVTKQQARAVADLVNRLAKAGKGKREATLREDTRKRFAHDEAAARLQAAAEVLGPIRFMCSLLFVFLFVVVPVLAGILGSIPLLIPAGIVMVVLAAQISFMFYRAHQRLYPLESPERLESLLKMLLCPPTSIRAPDLLTKHLLAEYSPVVVARLLPGSAQSFVRAFVLDLQHPLRHEVADETATEIMQWSLSEELKHCLEHLERDASAQPDVLLAPPLREGSSAFYCPRCGCQFLGSEGACPDCPGVGLLAFPRHEGAGG